MVVRLVNAFAAALLCATASAQAALYEVTVEGNVTFALFLDVNVGDPFTVKYVVDSTDLVPEPNGGRYAASGAIVNFPGRTLMIGNTESHFGVHLGGGTATDLAHYYTIQEDTLLGVRITYQFPPNTFESDALPLSLPLSIATLKRFHLFQGLWDMYRGEVTSYTAVEVPEPHSIGIVTFVSLAFGAARGARRGTGAGVEGGAAPASP
jgi:hypothetical protein